MNHVFKMPRSILLVKKLPFTALSPSLPFSLCGTYGYDGKIKKEIINGAPLAIVCRQTDGTMLSWGASIKCSTLAIGNV
jgi:hypothetical protein